MEKEKAIELIKDRIMDEHRKHSYQLDWSRIAAIKLYDQWSEYFKKEQDSIISEQKAEIERLMKALEMISKTPEGTAAHHYAIQALTKKEGNNG